MTTEDAESAVPQESKQAMRGLSPTVRALGVVSLCSDVSSEMVYPINPIFITKVLGAPAWAVGVIEGIAESTASLLKLYSGWLSDRMGARKPFALFGYGFGAIGKPLMAVSTVWGHVLGARFLDRLGKGLRSAPRDALITENCAPEQRGRAFGFHRSMDTVGAVMGPLIGFFFLRRYTEASLAANSDPLRWLYALAFLPGLLGVLVLALFVREGVERAEENRRDAETQRGKHDSGDERAASPRHPVTPPPLHSSSPRPALPSWASLSPAYRQYLLIVGLFGLGNSSDAFLLLRARDLGIGPEHLLLLYALFNVVEAVLGYPAGILSDRMGRRPLVALGYGIFTLVYLGFAVTGSTAAVWGLFILYGFYYTFTQGIQRALAADLAHPDRRATEIGAFHMLVGIAALPASLLAGQLYSHVAPSAPFFLGATTAALAALLLLTSRLEPARQAAGSLS